MSGKYVKFRPCVCGANRRTVHQLPNKKYYYGCSNCGRNSSSYATETEYKAKDGWNNFILTERLKILAERKANEQEQR